MKREFLIRRNGKVKVVRWWSQRDYSNYRDDNGSGYLYKSR